MFIYSPNVGVLSTVTNYKAYAGDIPWLSTCH